MTAFCIISVLGKDYEAPLEQYEWSVDFMRSFKAGRCAKRCLRKGLTA